MSDDGEWARCDRDEYAGALTIGLNTSPPTYAHKLHGDCLCGREHAPAKMATYYPSERLGTIECYYTYTTAEGQPLHRTVRYRDPKAFRQQRYEWRDCSWQWGLNGVQTVLYQLPELVNSRSWVPVGITEGEKDADKLWSLGMIATCAPIAANWSRHYNQWLRGRHIVLFEDNDEAGRMRAERVSAAICRDVASIRVATFPHLPEGGDISDWLALGGNLRALLAELGFALPPPGLVPSA